MSQPRIFAGKHRGRALKVMEGSTVRPTSGRTRESVFNILLHGRFGGENSPLVGGKVADIFCGTGAFGLEALSRGAANVTFVDQQTAVLKLTHENASKLGELPNSKFVQADAGSLPVAPAPYSLIFIDPPYQKGLVAPCLKSLLKQRWLDANTIVVVEMQAREEVTLPEGYTLLDERVYGNAKVWILEAA